MKKSCWIYFYISCIGFTHCQKNQTDEELMVNESQRIIRKTVVLSKDSTEFRKIELYNVSDQENSQIEIGKLESIVFLKEKQDFITGQYNKKHQYFNRKGDLLAQIRYYPNGFALEDADEKLLWRVSILKQIKISDNPKLQNALVIQTTPQKNFKVFAPTKTLGGVTFQNNRWIVKGYKQFDALLASTKSAALGVLLMQPIPETMRWIIFVELLRF